MKFNDLNIKPYRMIGIKGRSGSGKSTLMKIIAGLLSEYNGDLKILLDFNIKSLKEIVYYSPQKISLLSASYISSKN